MFMHENKLSEVADKPRGHMNTSACYHVVISLSFLAHISGDFQPNVACVRNSSDGEKK